MTQPIITDGNAERLDALADLYGRAFANDPVIRYMLAIMPEQERLAYIGTYWRHLAKAAVLNKGIISEVDDWKAASIMLPPGQHVDNPWTLAPAGLFSVMYRIGIVGCVRMLSEFGGKAEAAKKKGLKGQTEYWYFFGIATGLEHRGKGLAGALINYYKEIARKDNVPIWLEATTPHSHGIYQKHGFEDVEMMVLGKGKVSRDGLPEVGGEGVPIWGMVWWPTQNHKE